MNIVMCEMMPVEKRGKVIDRGYKLQAFECDEIIANSSTEDFNNAGTLDTYTGPGKKLFLHKQYWDAVLNGLSIDGEIYMTCERWAECGCTRGSRCPMRLPASDPEREQKEDRHNGQN